MSHPPYPNPPGLSRISNADRPSGGQGKLAWLAWMLLGALLALGGVSLWFWPSVSPSGLANGQPTPREVTPRDELTPPEQRTIDLFNRSSPSVVFITTRARRINPWTMDVTEVPRGNGSGFVWDKKGHIITNYHVIQNASGAEVALSGHQRLQAELVGVSPDHDLAVLKVDAPEEDLRPLPLGGSDGLKVGQNVYAIGNPFGLDQSLTTGVISALGRQIQSVSGRTIDGVIQTDAAINPGNSGGPLLDSAGRLIGVSTAIYSPSGASAGVGFAVPVDTVNRVVPQLIAKGVYRRPGIGVRVNERLSQAVLNRLGIDQGVLILEVQPDSPAQEAGLRQTKLTQGEGIVPGDIIVSLAGEPIRSTDDLLTVLDRQERGEPIDVTIIRFKEDGSKQRMTFTVRTQ
jgi:S1-C subfamily serine protease